MESNRANSGAAGIPVEWQSQFSAAFPCQPGQQQAPMMDSFASAGLWASTSQAMGLNDVSAMSAARGAGFLAPVPGFLPQGLGHFPVDSGFIERAARASCFGGRDGGVMGANAGFSAADQQMNNAFSGSSEALLDHQRKNGNDKNDELPSSEVAGGDGSSKGTSESKKRRRPNEMGADQVQSSNLPADSANESVHSKDKGEESSPATTTGKSKGKGTKETSESQKEDYIHVRARRGQATNSHSLAERLRREKINERMKLLQDIVPGCNKITGKAMMLDEIINYVQSLQRQVEFLSMKLSAISPELNCNLDLQDILCSQDPVSAFSGYGPQMSNVHLSLYRASQQGFSHGIIPNPANVHVARTAQLSAFPQRGVWEEQLRNMAPESFASGGAGSIENSH